MSGGVFNIISNTSAGDKLLYATEFLKERINNFIMNKEPRITEEDLLSLPDNDKYFNIKNSILPSLNEIERSHNTFINGSYKPCIPLASEYIKVQHANPKWGSTLVYQMPQIGNFTSDCMFHIRLSGMSAVDPRDRVRYVAMLGHRIIKHTQFMAQEGNIIDEYGTDDYNVYFQYELPGENMTGYLRNIGQETPSMANITNDPLVDMFQEHRFIGNGNQTLKHSHGTIDLFIPVLLWFKDTKNALPQLPWGKLQIKIDLAEVADVVGYFNGGGGGAYIPPKIEFCDLYVNQLFTIPEVFNLYIKKFVFSIIRVHRAHKQVITARSDNEYSILLNNLKWPTEVLYASFRPRENLSLSQHWHKSCKLTEKSYKVPVLAKDPSTVILVSPLANPVPTSNTITITSSSALSSTDDEYNTYDLVVISGHGYNKDITKNRYVVKSYNGATKAIVISCTWDNFVPDTTTVFELYTPQLASNQVFYYSEQPIVDKLALSANDIDIFKSNIGMFYNTYLPMKIGHTNVPTDCGMYMMPFCTNLYQQQPSGSINISLCRELYIKFTTSLISSSYPVDLICLSRSINFLLVDPSIGGMTLRYCV